MDTERILQRSRAGAVRAAMEASRSSAAYRSLLQEHGVEPGTLRVGTNLERLPVLTKANTFGRFSLNELARPVSPRGLADVLTSSGRGGRSFGFKLTGRKQHESSWFDIDLGLQDMFEVDERPTLLVNCLPMGVLLRSRAVAVANVSVREDMACSILRDVGPRFSQTLLCTDPLFIRRVLDEARVAGIDWKALNTSVIMGEEVLVEAQREYIAARMGIDLDADTHRLIGSSFGVGELGLNLLFETRETIRLRRAMRSQTRSTFNDTPSPTLFCFNPLRCYIEVLNPGTDGFGELCITMLTRQAIIPLPRYATGDFGRLVGREEVTQAASLASTPEPWLPVVAIRGRISDSLLGLPSVESIKELIYSDHAVADQLSGAFRISRKGSGEVILTLQPHAQGTKIDADLRNRLNEMVNRALIPRTTVTIEGRDSWGPALDYERKFTYIGQVE